MTSVFCSDNSPDTELGAYWRNLGSARMPLREVVTLRRSAELAVEMVGEGLHRTAWGCMDEEGDFSGSAEPRPWWS